MIQEIIDWLTQEKLQYQLTETKLRFDLSDAKMLLIESVFWYEKALELDRRPRNVEEAKDWSEEKAKQNIDIWYMRARSELYIKRMKCSQPDNK